MNKSTRLCGNILNINDDRITWKVDINLQGKCPSGRQRTKHKKQILKVFSQKQASKAAIILELWPGKHRR